ncbi:MAG: hypothetical protein F6K53_20090 [Moorea sp. SIO4A1]|nr:hypothetical protein [Moorena sp. SIO4A1]
MPKYFSDVRPHFKGVTYHLRVVAPNELLELGVEEFSVEKITEHLESVKADTPCIVYCEPNKEGKPALFCIIGFTNEVKGINPYEMVRFTTKDAEEKTGELSYVHQAISKDINKVAKNWYRENNKTNGGFSVLAFN